MSKRQPIDEWTYSLHRVMLTLPLLLAALLLAVKTPPFKTATFDATYCIKCLTLLNSSTNGGHKAQG